MDDIPHSNPVNSGAPTHHMAGTKADVADTPYTGSSAPDDSIGSASPSDRESYRDATPAHQPASGDADTARKWVTEKLLAHHLEHLRTSGLNDETIAKAELRSVTEPEEARSILRWMPSMRPPGVPAIAFPYRPEYVRLRPDVPRRHKDGHEVKYEGPEQVASEIYAPANVNPSINDHAIELYLTEGEKKCLATNQAGIATVAAPGVDCFHNVAARKDSKKEGLDEWELHPQLDKLVRRASAIKPRRDVVVALDSDIDRNQRVQWSAARLIQMLRVAGAAPLITFIEPGEDDEKVGLDDLYVSLDCDAAAFRTVLDAAKRPTRPDKLLEWTASRWSQWDSVRQQRELRRALWLVARTHTPDILKRWCNDAVATLKVAKQTMKSLQGELWSNDDLAMLQEKEESDWLQAPDYCVIATPPKAGVWTTHGTKLGDRIARAPMNVIDIGADEHDRQYATVRFAHGEQVIEHIIPRGHMAGPELLSLAAFGAPVTAVNRAAMQEFLAAQEQYALDGMPRVPIFTQCGWSKDVSSFVLGRQVIGGIGRSLVESADNFLDALQPGGDERIHRDLVLEARRASIFGELGESAGVAAVLIRLLAIRSILVSIWGKSGGGKSAGQAVAVSHFGRPEGMKLTGNCTPTALEGALKRSRDLPLWFDDTQLTQSRELLDMLAYQVSAGTGKGRGTPTGDLRALSNWLAIAFVSGEKPLLKLGIAQGARNRTVELRFQPFEDESFPGYLHRELNTHHGHTGPVLIRSLLERVIRPGKVGTLRALYSGIAQRIADKRDEKVDQIALLALGNLASRVFIHGEPERDAADAAVLFGRRLHAMVHTAADVKVDRIAAGHEAIRAWINEHVAEFASDSGDKQRRRYGAAVEHDNHKDDDVFAIFRDPLLDCARRAGFDLDEVLHGLKERKKLIEGEADGDGYRLQRRTRELGNARAYWIVFDGDAKE